jgi:glycosyltransferase involved in cell wall biosynthesis
VISLDVIIPFFGDPEYLMRAVASVQSLQNAEWKLAIIEDCYPSGQDVERRVGELGDDRITYLRNERNLGVAGNQHRCMQSAELDYFVVLDADDLLLPNYGQQVAALIERYPDAGVIQPGVAVIDEHDAAYRPLPDRVKHIAKPRSGTFELAGEAAAASLLRGNWLYTPALTYRRDLSRSLTERPNCDAINDLSIVLDIIVAGGTLAIGHDVAFHYRRHRKSHSSTTAKTGQRFQQERAFFDTIEQEMTDRGWTTAAKAARRRLFSRLNALTQVPTAILARQGGTTRTLLSHALH